jgi:hypothetical protein
MDSGQRLALLPLFLATLVPAIVAASRDNALDS